MTKRFSLAFTIFIFLSLSLLIRTVLQASGQGPMGLGSLSEAYSIQQTIDGGYIVAGESWSFDYDICGSLKLDPRVMSPGKKPTG